MTLLRLLILLAPVLTPRDEFRERREKLRQAYPKSAILLQGAGDRDRPDLRSGFVQEPNFFYLTGWNQAGAALLLLPEGTEPREILFLPDHDERRERYEGRRAAAQDDGLDKLTGFAVVRSATRIEEESARHPVLRLKDVGAEIAKMRQKKSAREVGLIERAVEASVEGHLAAWRRAQNGVREYQVAAAATGVFLDRGCERNAYPPIVGAGPRGVILHYNANAQPLRDGELLLMDMGAECAYYAADLTRTIPVKGRFSARQKELYQAVLGAQKAAIAAVRPGATLPSLTRVAREYFEKRGLEVHFTHAIGHHVGLEVHDPGPAAELEPGMVITIEPGLYLAEEGIGIRIEDMVLVTETGGRVLSAGLPKEIGEIEKRLAK